MGCYLSSRKSIILIFLIPIFIFSEDWESAKKAYSFGEFQRAYEIYIKIAEDSESFQEKAQAYIYAAWCKYTMGEKENINELFSKALENWPDIPLEEELFNEEFNDIFKQAKGLKIPEILPENKDLILSQIDELNLSLQNRKYKDCINKAKQILTQFKYKQIYKAMGDCYLAQNNLEDALETYKMGVKAPLFVKEETILTPEAQLKKARSLYRRGEKKQALQILNSLIYSYNPPAEAFGFLGLIFMEDKLYFEAEKVLSQGLLLNSGNANYYNLYGVSLYAQGKYNEAIKLFQQAVSIDRFLAPPLVNLASSYAQFKEFTTAETYFSQAILLDPTNEFYLSEYGKTLLSLGKYKEAVAKFSETIRYAKDPTPYLFYRGIANLFDKNLEESFKDLDAYVSKNSEDIKAIEIYGLLLKEQKQCSKAIEYLKRCNSDVSKRTLAQCYLTEKKPQEAIEILKNLPQEVPILNDLASAYLMVGEYKKAYETINKIPKERRAGSILENIEKVKKIYSAYSSFSIQ